MEETPQSVDELIFEAKQAVLAGDKALARSLAEQALALDGDAIDALLVMAGISDPQESLNYLSRVLSLDPTNETAQEGMQWAAQSAREETAAAWTPENTTQVKVAPAPQPQVSTRKPSFVLPWIFAAIVVTVIGLYSSGVIKLSPVKGLELINFGVSQPDIPATETAAISTASQKLTKSALVTQAVQKTEQAMLSSATLQSSTATVLLPTATPTEKPTKTPQPTPTPTPTPTPAVTETPEATVPTQEIDPDSGLPIIQITPIAYLTEPSIINAETWVDTSTAEGEVVWNELPEPYREPLGEKWIDIDLTRQMLYAYEGDTVVASFLVSTGLPDTPTITGSYNVYVKYYAADMRGPGYYLPDVPYTMYYYRGYGIHGTYWHSNFGTPMSHGCVNMETSEAGWLFEWSYVGIPVIIHY